MIKLACCNLTVCAIEFFVLLKNSPHGQNNASDNNVLSNVAQKLRRKILHFTRMPNLKVCTECAHIKEKNCNNNKHSLH